MKAQLPWSLEETDLAFCHSGGLVWDAREALVPMGARSGRRQHRRTGAPSHGRGPARPGDHILCMINGGFGGVHQKLLDALQKT